MHFMTDLSPLFSSLAGILMRGGGSRLRVDWSIGKVTLDREALIVGALTKSYRLPLMAYRPHSQRLVIHRD